MILNTDLRARRYSTFNISHIANILFNVITIKTKKPSTLTKRNVRLSNLLISTCKYVM